MNRLQFAQTIIFVSGGKVHNDKSNELALVTWMAQENSHAKWNPFDTELAMPGSWDYNPQGVKNYPTLQTGLRAFFLTLENGAHVYGYDGIIHAMAQGGCACAVVEAVAKSEYGTWRGDPAAAVRMVQTVEKNFTLYSTPPIGT